jgi:hypothetical protein
MLSQNATFIGEAPPYRKFDHPPGEGLATELRAALSDDGIAVSEPEDWRDSGWELICTSAQGDVAIAFAATSRDAWFLQVAPVRVRGLIDVILRRTVPDLTDECMRVSRSVDAFLKRSGRYSEVRWRADGPPDEANSSSEPVVTER